MKKYEVHIKSIIETTRIVEAENESEARSIVYNLLSAYGDIVDCDIDVYEVISENGKTLPASALDALLRGKRSKCGYMP